MQIFWKSSHSGKPKKFTFDVLLTECILNIKIYKNMDQNPPIFDNLLKCGHCHHSS